MDRPNHDQLTEVIDLMKPDTHTEDDADYENDVGMTPDTGEIPDAADKGAARSAIIVMTAVTITGCSWPQHLAEAMHTDDP